MSELRITCDLADGGVDEITFINDPSYYASDHVLLRADKMAGAVLYINEDKARELFNWLGVWLHGGNRD